MKRFPAEAASCKFPLLTSLLIVGAVVVSTRADITGFNNGVNFTLNSPDGGGSISGDTATLTNNQTFEATSVYYNTPQSISAGFQASFTYQATGGNSFALADGMTFVLQNAGLNAVGDRIRPGLFRHRTEHRRGTRHLDPVQGNGPWHERQYRFLHFDQPG